jgi:hypothetical protein
MTAECSHDGTPCGHRKPRDTLTPQHFQQTPNEHRGHPQHSWCFRASAPHASPNLHFPNAIDSRCEDECLLSPPLRHEGHPPDVEAQCPCHHRAYPRRSHHTTDGTPITSQVTRGIQDRPSSACRGARGDQQETERWGSSLWKRRGRPHGHRSLRCYFL